ncbi:MAG: hypothetical protein JNL67_04690 [Planctomycetaceae bacterium]|nr:hypothetical protein [Planctomycetaceae bacterium]
MNADEYPFMPGALSQPNLGDDDFRCESTPDIGCDQALCQSHFSGYLGSLPKSATLTGY